MKRLEYGYSNLCSPSMRLRLFLAIVTSLTICERRSSIEIKVNVVEFGFHCLQALLLLLLGALELVFLEAQALLFPANVA